MFYEIYNMGLHLSLELVGHRTCSEAILTILEQLSLLALGITFQYRRILPIFFDFYLNE